MRRLILDAPAKINLSLDVVGRRDDGYHLLSTVMQSLQLADRVTLTAGLPDPGVSLMCDLPELPVDRRNTAWRAAGLFLEKTGLSAKTGCGVRISIEKKIPLEAGLAGGSADAAAVLAGLDLLYPDYISQEQLFDLAARIGADVPFCLRGGTALCEGIGEKLTSLAAWEHLPVLLCKPVGGLLTSWVFSQLRMDRIDRRPDQTAVLDAIRRQNLHSLAGVTANVLESVSLPAMPELVMIKQKLLESGAELALMSGSGPTVFGLFKNQEACQAACETLRHIGLPCLALLPTVTSAFGPRPAPRDAGAAGG